ncbi:prephenate dehydratase [Candidatus Poriferisodalis sp.]|uniref:prephenate dehydratase n=1 Tax=Candidatus Poriferisodalis sp. TaxID=3101277 RepID=UPI003B521B04
MATAGSSTGATTLLPSTRIGYMGPPGTFTESALQTQSDLVRAALVPLMSIPHVLDALETGSVDFGFIPIENAIEGSVNIAQDALAFDFDFLIQREVVVDVQLDLMALPGTATADDLSGIHTVKSFPVALAQCQKFLDRHLPEAQIEETASTALAARDIRVEERAGVAAIASRAAADLYELEIVAPSVHDNPHNQTRFMLVGKGEIPPPTGNDKTSIVVFQHHNEPGSLMNILMEFESRRIDLTSLHSRPAGGGIGAYCFLVDFEGHLCDYAIGDCLRALKMKQRDVKFLGSYPAAKDSTSNRSVVSDEAWANAVAWLGQLRKMMT